MGNVKSRNEIVGKIIGRKKITGNIDMDNWASTVDEKEFFTFRWDLEHYSTMSENTTIVSPTFEGGAESKHKWYMMIYPKRKLEGDVEYFQLYLCLESARKSESGDPIDEGKVKLNYEWCLMDGDSVPLKGINTKVVSCYEYTKKEGYGLGKSIKSSDLAQLVSQNDDRLQIFAQFWIAGKFKHESGSSQGKWTVKKKEKDQVTSSMLQSLLSTGVLSDVEFCTEDDPKAKKFKAHKVIVAGRSPVFAKMFEVDMSESATNTVIIPDFKDDIVEAMLLHIYGGTSDNLVTLAPDLLKIAEKYDIGSLKDECVAAISPNVTLTNVISVLKLASTFNAPELKRKSLDIINGNKARVMKTTEFSSLSRELLGDLYMADNEKLRNGK